MAHSRDLRNVPADVPGHILVQDLEHGQGLATGRIGEALPQLVDLAAARGAEEEFAEEEAGEIEARGQDQDAEIGEQVGADRSGPRQIAEEIKERDDQEDR